MNILSVLCLGFLVFDILIIAHLFSIGARKKTHALFIIMLVFYAIWNATGVLLYSAGDKDAFLRMSPVCAAFVFCLPLTLHFVLSFCSIRIRIRAPLLLIAYALSLVFYALFLKNELLYVDYEKRNGFWHFVSAPLGWPQIGFILYCAAVYVIPMILLFRWKKSARYKREKSQANILISALGAVVALFLLEYAVKDRMNANVQASAVYSNLWTLGIWISILKYRFMTVTPDRISKLVIEHMDQALFVTEMDGAILFLNAAAQIVLKPKSAPEGSMVADLLRSPAEIEKARARLANGEKGPIHLRAHLAAGDGSAASFDLEMRLIADKSGDGLGILILGREVKEMNQFKALFGVTDREVEVIHAVLSGYSSRQIAERLSIAERTVKSHIEHVYVKLNVSNRVQLFNLVKEYNLFGGLDDGSSGRTLKKSG